MEFAELKTFLVFSEPCWYPEGCYAFETRTIFKKKWSKTGAMERWKARLVAQGSPSLRLI